MLGLCLLVTVSCRTADKISVLKMRGNTMGTYYEITYISDRGYMSMQPRIDSLLEVFNQSVSTYLPTSVISRVNKANAGDTIPVDDYFATVFTTAQEVYQKTGGAFDPSVMPLVNAWGFGYKKNPALTPPDSAAVDSLLKLVDFTSFTLLQNPYRIIKGKQHTELDFSAIAKGYGVDVAARFMQDNGINRYLVDIGGEIRANGMNPQDYVWVVAIDQPNDDPAATNREAAALIQLNNRSIATSGNYRNFQLIDGKKYAHTIDPTTGFPKMSDLLSVSVLHQNCITADAYATAFMVLGYQKARNIVENNPQLDALFIYTDTTGNMQVYRTPGAD